MIDGRYELVRELGAGSMGVVHLAEDVFLDRQVAIKVIDPRHASDPSTVERKFSITAGTPMYMAPEQATDPDGTRVTFRADIYALACTAYELFTGRAVFEGDDVFTILKGHLKSPPPPLSTHRPDLAHLDAAFTRALAKVPEERHESAVAFVEELATAVQKRDARQKRDTLAPASSIRSANLPVERVLVLGRDEALVRQLARVTTRVVGGASRTAAVQHVASASALVAAFSADPAAIVLVDEESSELGMRDLVHMLRQSPGGASASILVVSREWQALRPALGAMGVHDVLPKPLVVQMLAQTVERIVARRSAAAHSGT